MNDFVRWGGPEILSTAEMAAADALTIDAGTPGIDLMEAAGARCAEAATARWPVAPTLVMCGPGNNGGDGFVIARLLEEQGWPVRLAMLGGRDRLAGDAALAASRWDGGIEELSPEIVGGAEVFVDALFGTGLDRPLDGVARAVVEAVNARTDAKTLAVDIPSGVNGDSALSDGVAVRADVTVTFFRRKPAHLLAPGKRLCGEIVVADIGIAGGVLAKIEPKTWENGLHLWRDHLPYPDETTHKYVRGHAIVASGAMPMTGAARLAARAALRIGAGVVTIASPADALAVHAARLDAVMVREAETAADLEALLSDQRITAALIGPGAGLSEETRAKTIAVTKAAPRAVLDADALTAFEDAPGRLFEALHGNCVLTPHAGEFARLFPNIAGHSKGKLADARIAADAAMSAIVYKGADTVIADTIGRAAINTGAPPDLATAGSGDVLGGIILGLAAQGMSSFRAACASVWIHGRAAALFGPGLISEDLPDLLPAVIRELRDG